MTRSFALAAFVLAAASAHADEATFRYVAPPSAFHPHAMSADGLTIVGLMEPTPLSYQPAVWRNETLTVLTSDLPGFILAVPYAVSADGAVIVGEGRLLGGGTEAFRWENGHVTRLGDLQGGIPSSVARAISADGSLVAGWGYGPGGEDRAVRWEHGTISALEVLPDSRQSHALNVSADGHTIVGTCYVPCQECSYGWINRPVVWRDGHIEALPATEQQDAFATAASADGSTLFGYNSAGYLRWQGGGEGIIMSGCPLCDRASCDADGRTFAVPCTSYMWLDGVGRVDFYTYFRALYGINIAAPSGIAGISADGRDIAGLQQGGHAWLFHRPYDDGPPPDADGDGVPDPIDLCPGTIPGASTDFYGCPPAAPGDLDGDGDVDLRDFYIMQSCLSGAETPADPACGMP